MILDTVTDQITLQYQQVSSPDFTTVGVEKRCRRPWHLLVPRQQRQHSAWFGSTIHPVYGQAGGAVIKVFPHPASPKGRGARARSLQRKGTRARIPSCGKGPEPELLLREGARARTPFPRE